MTDVEEIDRCELLIQPSAEEYERRTELLERELRLSRELNDEREMTIAEITKQRVTLIKENERLKAALEGEGMEYIETNALVAAMDKDVERCKAELRKLSVVEKDRLYHAIRFLDATLENIEDEEHGGEGE